MNKKLFLVLILFISFGNLFLAQNNKNEKVRKTVFIIVDGIAPDMLDKANIPNLKRVISDGAFLQAYVGGGKDTYSESPTISAVGYNHVLTGVWTNKHNVWGNGIEHPNYNYPTVFRLFKNQYPLKKTAIFSTWLDNRTKLVGEGLEATGKIKTDIHYDGYENDTINFPHDKNALYIKKIDSLVTEKASKIISESAPDLSWVYLEHTDDVGHQHGDSQKLYDIITYEDKLIGKIYDAVKFREQKFNEDWLFIVTTDHGRGAENGKDHGGQTDRERSTWIALNKPNINAYAKKTKQVGAVDILPTIADYMNISVPQKYKQELDGIGLLNFVPAYGLKSSLQENILTVNWIPLATSGSAEIFITNTNNFKTGGADVYKSLGKVSLKTGKFKNKVNLPKSDIYKIVLKIGNHYLNTWIVDKNKK